MTDHFHALVTSSSLLANMKMRIDRCPSPKEAAALAFAFCVHWKQAESHLIRLKAENSYPHIIAKNLVVALDEVLATEMSKLPIAEQMGIMKDAD